MRNQAGARLGTVRETTHGINSVWRGSAGRSPSLDLCAMIGMRKSLSATAFGFRLATAALAGPAAAQTQEPIYGRQWLMDRHKDPLLG
jgi:hypothetical protein